MIEKNKLYVGQKVWLGTLKFTTGLRISKDTIKKHRITKITEYRIILSGSISIPSTLYGMGYESSVYETYEDAAFDRDCIIRSKMDRLTSIYNEKINDLNKLNELVRNKTRG